MRIRQMNALGWNLSAHVVGAMMVIAAVWFVGASRAAQPVTQPAIRPSTQPVKELVLDLGNKVTMNLTLIPAGKFMMGSAEDEKDHFDNEGPRHEVTISRPFYMGAYTVTQAQWKAVMGAEPWKGKDKDNKEILKEYATEDPACPATYVSWDDVVEFCKRVSGRTRMAVRIPTEAQWEYACRAGSTTRFSYGDDDKELGDCAWYMKNAEGKVHPVGQKKANDWGLYDMHGNVWQWCLDWYDKDTYAHSPKSDPQGPAGGTHRVVRGGGLTRGPVGCRSADRHWVTPAAQVGNGGFRIIVELK